MHMPLRIIKCEDRVDVMPGPEDDHGKIASLVTASTGLYLASASQYSGLCSKWEYPHLEAVVRHSSFYGMATE